MDQEIKPIILYLKDETLPEYTKLAIKIIPETTLYAIFDDILYYIGPTQKEMSQVVVPYQISRSLLFSAELVVATHVHRHNELC